MINKAAILECALSEKPYFNSMLEVNKFKYFHMCLRKLFCKFEIVLKVAAKMTASCFTCHAHTRHARPQARP